MSNYISFPLHHSSDRYNHNVQDEAAFPLLLDELRRAELELSRTPQKWKAVWNRLEAQNLPFMGSQGPEVVSSGGRGAVRGLLSPSAMDLGASIVRKVDVLVRGEFVCAHLADMAVLLHDYSK